MKQNLNKQQIASITADLNKILVIAGAGTGKTTVLIERAIHLIKEKKINQHRILLITFTNQAVKQIKTKIEKQNVKITNVITFHAFFSLILREHIHLIGWKNNFRVINEKNKNNLIKRKAKDLISKILVHKVVKCVDALKICFLAKHSFTNEEFQDFLNEFPVWEEYRDSWKPLLEIYQQYLKISKQENAIDFDDIIIYTRKLLDIKEALDYWSNSFDAILIDEFQDIDILQLQIMEMISKKKKNIFCVGDPDQSIYGFRGAKESVFSEFIKKYPETEVIKLEQNYRSTNKILAVANKIINNKEGNLKKVLFSELGEGGNVEYFFAERIWEEPDWIIKKIENELSKEKDFSLNDVAILSRTKNNSFYIESLFKKSEIPYRVFGSNKLFEKQEILFILNFLSLILFESSLSLEAIFSSKFIGGLGDTYMKKLLKQAEENNQSLYESVFLNSNYKFANKKTAINIFTFIEMVEKLKEEFFDLKPKEMVKKIITITGYEQKLIEKNETEKIENIEIFGEVLEHFYEGDIKETISKITMNSDYLAEGEIEEGINVSTIHKMKGLEYKYVFLLGFVNGLCPFHKTWNNNQELAEERRLVYVAITRAKKRLFLSGSKDQSLKFKPKDDDFESIFAKEIKTMAEVSIINKNLYKSSNNW